MDWDDFRHVLAIARAGSLSGAGRRLRVDPTTVGRRLSALEARLGVPLFLRSRTGFRLTEAGEEAVAAAEVMEAEMLALAEAVGAAAEAPSGRVRIATVPWIFYDLITPALPAFARRYPLIEVHGIAGLRERSLSNREAELALRFEMRPRGRERAIPIATIAYALYAPKGADPAVLPWIGWGEESDIYAPGTWLDEKLRDNSQRVCFRANDAGIIHRAIAAGAGKGLVPEVLGEGDPALDRLSGPEPELIRTLRVLVHPDVARFARVSAVIDWLRNTIACACAPAAV